MGGWSSEQAGTHVVRHGCVSQLQSASQGLGAHYASAEMELATLVHQEPPRDFLRWEWLQGEGQALDLVRAGGPPRWHGEPGGAP